jgi:TusA-related sulfurtransferase
MSDAITVDARGLSCPEPVMMAKQAMRRSDATKVEVMVDSGASRDNVQRTARLAGWTVRTVDLPGGEYRLELEK